MNLIINRGKRNMKISYYIKKKSVIIGIFILFASPTITITQNNHLLEAMETTNSENHDDLIDEIIIKPIKPKIRKDVSFSVNLTIPYEEVSLCLWAFQDGLMLKGINVNRSFLSKGEYECALFVYTTDGRYDNESFSISVKKIINDNNILRLYFDFFKFQIWNFFNGLNKNWFNNIMIHYQIASYQIMPRFVYFISNI